MLSIQLLKRRQSWSPRPCVRYQNGNSPSPSPPPPPPPPSPPTVLTTIVCAVSLTLSDPRHIKAVNLLSLVRDAPCPATQAALTC